MIYSRNFAKKKFWLVLFPPSPPGPLDYHPKKNALSLQMKVLEPQHVAGFSRVLFYSTQPTGRAEKWIFKLDQCQLRAEKI